MFWTLVHKLVWNGEVASDDDFGFPLNIIANLFTGGAISDRSALSRQEGHQGDIRFGNYFNGHIPNLKQKLGSSLSEVSLNNLYNFLTEPGTAASNLFLSMGFVSDSIKFAHHQILFNNSFLISTT